MDYRGYIVPWFLCDQDPVGLRTGKWDFRLLSADRPIIALNEMKCWLCGFILGKFKTFVIGPMCMINRVTSEPPCHLECAVFAVKACPFLTTPQAVRRSAGMPKPGEIGFTEGPGVSIDHNPGTTVLWTVATTSKGMGFGARQQKDGVLIQLGDPAGISIWSQGREAEPEDLEASIAKGLPHLFGMAQQEDAVGTDCSALNELRLSLARGVQTVIRLHSREMGEAMARASLKYLPQRSDNLPGI